MIVKQKNADVAELVDAPDLGSGFARSEGSSPFIRIELAKIACFVIVTVSISCPIWTTYAYKTIRTTYAYILGLKLL